MVSTDIIIRKADLKDWNEVVTLHLSFVDALCKTNPEDYTNRGLVERLRYTKQLMKYSRSSSHRILVAQRSDGEIVAYMVGQVFTYPAFCKLIKAGEVMEVYVREDSRGRNLGERLFKELLIFFKEKEVQVIEALVDSENETAVRFWEKLNFKDKLRTYKLEL